jgi:hypothetical protein
MAEIPDALSQQMAIAAAFRDFRNGNLFQYLEKERMGLY